MCPEMVRTYANLVVVGAALQGREDRKIDPLLVIVHRALGLALLGGLGALAEEDHS
jgi:hypothetical protein